MYTQTACRRSPDRPNHLVKDESQSVNIYFATAIITVSFGLHTTCVCSSSTK